jgi:hypothetical protein
MLAIDEAMMRVQQIQKDLSIDTLYKIQDGEIATETVDISIKRAYPYFAGQNNTVTDFPCFINQWTAPTVEFASVLMTGEFSLHMQLLIKDANLDRSCMIASAFYPKVLQAFAENIKLNAWGPATVRRIRGADPTNAVLSYGGLDYGGLDLFLDIYLNKAKVMEA